MKNSQKTLAIALLCALTAFATASCGGGKGASVRQPVDYVNPYIGNISHLLVPTYPTVHLPNSMLRVIPLRDNFTSDMLNGLPVVWTSHRGMSAFSISPVAQLTDSLSSRSMERYSYSNEHITPYRYRVHLDEAGIDVDFAPAHKSALYHISFDHGNANLIFSTQDGDIVFKDGAVQGYQVLKDSVRAYLYLETEQTPIKSLASEKAADPDAQRKPSQIALAFDKPSVNLRYGISFISIEQAKKNLNSEITDYDIDKLADSGRRIWNETLGKIQVEGSSVADKEVFYTALYRTYERMIAISEDGNYYSAFDNKVHSDSGRTFYTDDWIWDTYRAVHPLRILIEPEMEQDMLQSYILMSQQSPTGWMPTFPVITGDNRHMNGNHGVATILDAYQKGLRNFDFEGAYKAYKKTLTERSLLPWTDIPKTALDLFYDEKGYFPGKNPGEKETVAEVHPFERRQVIAITLAACYDDWCVAKMAQIEGDTAAENYFAKRSLNYRNVYNAETGFFHPRNAKGDFIQPFDYRFSGDVGGRDYYDENNAWIYRWETPHNIPDLIALMGGKEKFVENLDRTFREPLGMSRYAFYNIFPDHSGNVGQYSMGNEPCLHIPYLYNYAQQAWKTQRRVRALLRQWFRPDLMGIPGDEDGGGLSAFVVFSALGFYPVTPGIPEYAIGSPVFEKAKVSLGHGKTFSVVCKNYSPDNIYIQSAQLNGKTWNKAFFSHEELMQGGTLELTMGNKPNKVWGSE